MGPLPFAFPNDRKRPGVIVTGYFSITIFREVAKPGAAMR
jgi:hypothetical protein